MLTKIIYKNFRSNFKNYVAFFIGNMMGVTEFFVFWGLYSIVKNMSANSVMLEDTLEEIIISVSVITIFSTALMVYSMLNYIKKRIADYSLFYILGMKKQKLYVFVFSEYLAGWMVSLLIGLGIGRGILYLIQQIWHKLFPTYISLCSVGTEIYFNTCKISFFIMLAVVFVLLIWADNSGISRMIAGNEIKEKSKKIVTDAVSKLSAEMVLTPDIPDTLLGINMLGNTNAGSASSNVDLINAVNDLSNRMVDIMSRYFPQFANQQLVMDTGTLVGEIAPAIDDKMGRRLGHKERGI